MDFKKLVKQTFILLGFSVILALIANYFSPVGIALVGRWDTSRGVISAQAKNDVVAGKLEIEDVTRAKQIFDDGLLILPHNMLHLLLLATHSTFH